MPLVDRHPLIEDVLGAWAEALGTDRTAYRGHSFRVYNFARRLLGSARHDDELAVASAFHDLGIWSDRTFDYLGPSIARARAHLAARLPALPATAVAAAIDSHHRLRRVRTGPDAALVEAFRRADLIDVSHGLIRAGLDRDFHREVLAAFPYAGFHRMLVRTAAAWFIRHPLRPLPMLRLR